MLCRLEPHESGETDVILLGHSMGGLLLAETVLLPARSQWSSPLEHRVLGTINFDTPFLGMHPGIIKAGLESIFRSDDSPPPVAGQAQAGDIMDPNYNPPFFNDTRLPVRSAWRNAAHFVNKHSNNLTNATKQAFASHIEFGKCMADYDGLKIRYCRIRMLEDENLERRRTVVHGNRPPPRIRFVNYYTASTGRPKKPKAPAENLSPVERTPSMNAPIAVHATSANHRHRSAALPNLTRPEKAAAIPVEDSDDETVLSDLSDLDTVDDLESNFDDDSTIDGEAVSYINEKGPRVSAPIPRRPVPEFGGASSSQLRSIDPEPYNEPRWSERQSVSESIDGFDPSQPGLPPEPEAPGPPPSAHQFADVEKYRAELHEHGVASKAYFREAKRHQKALFDQFMAESKARTAACHAEIKRQSELLAEEGKRIGEAVRENGRIVTEISQEEIQSLLAHRKMVAEYMQQCGPRLSAKLNKVDKKLAGQQAKIARKVQQDRDKMQQKQAKMRKRLNRPGLSKSQASSSTTTDTMSRADSSDDLETLASNDSFFNATKPFAGIGISGYERSLDHGARKVIEIGTAAPTYGPPPPPGAASKGYDIETAPIADSIRHSQILDTNADISDSPYELFTPTTSGSQISLQTEPAVGTFSYDTITPQSSNTSASTNTSHDPMEDRTSTPKPAKDKKFCSLPPADASGAYDPTWVRVYMENVDEVGAHCGLFFSNAPSDGPADSQGWSYRYAKLVGDVSERIEVWIGDEMTRRAVEMLGEEVD